MEELHKHEKRVRRIPSLVILTIAYNGHSKNLCNVSLSCRGRSSLDFAREDTYGQTWKITRKQRRRNHQIHTYSTAEGYRHPTQGSRESGLGVVDQSINGQSVTGIELQFCDDVRHTVGADAAARDHHLANPASNRDQHIWKVINPWAHVVLS